MTRVAVDSTNLKSVGYEPATHKLHIEFHSGKVAEYDNVGPDMADGLMSADSKGQYFHKHIRGKERHPWRYLPHVEPQDRKP